MKIAHHVSRSPVNALHHYHISVLHFSFPVKKRKKERKKHPISGCNQARSQTLLHKRYKKYKFSVEADKLKS